MEKMLPEDLAGIYREIAEIVGVDATIKIHESFCGQQIAFPKKIYTIDYIKKQIIKNYRCGGECDIKKLATKFGYTERHFRQLLRNEKEKS